MCMTYSQQIHSTLNNLGARTAIRIYWENNCLWETFQELSVVESFLFYSVLSILFKSAFLMVFLIHLTCPPQTFFFLQHLMEENCSKDLGRTYAKLCGLYMHLISQALGDFFIWRKTVDLDIWKGVTLLTVWSNLWFCSLETSSQGVTTTWTHYGCFFLLNFWP